MQAFSIAEHYGAATRHLEFAKESFERGENEWTVVGLFYSALHLANGFLVTKKIHSRSHETTNSCLERIADSSAIYADYRILLHDSWQARYDPTCRLDRNQVAGRTAPAFNRVAMRLCQLIGHAPIQFAH